MTATSTNPSAPTLAAGRAEQMARHDKLNNRAMAWLAALAIASVIGAGVASYTGFGAWRVPDAPVVTERLIQFSDRAEGGVTITDATTGAPIRTLTVGEGGFIRGVVRSLVRERKLEQAGREAPFRLARRVDGLVILQDTATGRVVHLNSFGPTNQEAFAGLLDNKGKAP